VTASAWEQSSRCVDAAGDGNAAFRCRHGECAAGRYDVTRVAEVAAVYIDGAAADIQPAEGNIAFIAVQVDCGCGKVDGAVERAEVFYRGGEQVDGRGAEGAGVDQCL